MLEIFILITEWRIAPKSRGRRGNFFCCNPTCLHVNSQDFLLTEREAELNTFHQLQFKFFLYSLNTKDR
jgi:hypothetical protein